MSTYQDQHLGCLIVVETGAVADPARVWLRCVVAVVITCAGTDLGYAPPQYEGSDDESLAAHATFEAKVYIQKNRG